MSENEIGTKILDAAFAILFSQQIETEPRP